MDTYWQKEHGGDLLMSMIVEKADEKIVEKAWGV